MSQKTGYETGARLKWMEPIFKQWIILNKRYQKFHPDDLLSYYGERPSVGVLAAAAWSNPDGYALQEYYAEKRESQDGEELKSGREDLYLGLGECFALKLEAKRMWVNAHSQLENGEFYDAFETRMTAAKEDAILLWEDDKRAALVIAHFRSLKMSSALISDTIEAVRKVNVRTKAWFFSDSDEIEKGYRYYCFGTALFISDYLNKTEQDD